MELRVIDKVNFKRSLNWFQGGIVLLLLVLSLVLSELYRALWADGGSNFWLNAAAVVSAAAVVALVVGFIKDHDALKDVMHVWRIKQELNRIYRASKKLQVDLNSHIYEAQVIKCFQLHASKYVYLLEDNTLTLSELNDQITELEESLENQGVSISPSDYRPEMLDRL